MAQCDPKFPYNPNPPKDWGNILFLTLSPVLAFPVLIWYTYQTGFQWWMFGLFLTLYSLTGLSICAGYHRFYSHKSYECSWPVQFFYAVFGAMSVQNSILAWSSGHRRHHSYPETEWDPYSIKRGFWWAHILWIFEDNSATRDFDNVKDLQKQPIVMWQHRWCKMIGLGFGLALPTAIGWYFGNPIAGLLWGGFLRIVMVHHSTFSINSWAHKVGAQTYDDESTARDNWVIAFATFGEGFHSFHHRFPADFRNGVRWYNWDPAKWFITAMKWIGLASDLRITAASTIEQTRMEVAVKKLETRIALAGPTHAEEIHRRIANARDAFKAAMVLWKAQAEERAKGQKEQYRATYREYRERLKAARREWQGVLQAMKQIPSPNA
ncbi:MAG: fatty acid desaturase [Planctomycetota bacterium]